ncbi:putative F-box/LRR-repeat protein At5g02930 [Solanum tuberosum]|uniref:putative F-box/LRR-repeat protein At5g02930 n=1 Tax=Solanum tuberosum TaxID=4113 RepID=UPI00073A4424|nr:PREDICTED: putative F-box/LRR-repeat protein At5g02930 [Solanum tuberosum]
MFEREARDDRISELPVHIIHHSLCYCTKLNLKEAARSCILSKRWYYCWISRPHLIFDQFEGNKYMPPEKYVKLVDQSLRSHVEQNLRLELLILGYRDEELDSHLDTWIELAVKLNVTLLGISLPLLISLPDAIYAAKKLTVLWLCRCKFEFDISTTCIRFCCLRDLSLYDVHISDDQLQRLIERSPYIRNLMLQNCQGISKLHVFGLVYLEDLAAQYSKFDSVIVQAPNLRCFTYAEHEDNFLPREIAILDGYNTLQTLKLTGANITDQQFRDLSYKFPNISELNLTECYKLKNIEIQSEKLKIFTLLKLKSLEKVTVQAPNLLEFDFVGDKMPFSFMDPSSLERAQLVFSSLSTNLLGLARMLVN